MPNRGVQSQSKGSSAHRSNSPKIVVTQKQQSTSQKERGRQTPTRSRKSPISTQSTHESENKRKGTPSLEQGHLDLSHSHDGTLLTGHSDKHDANQELQIDAQICPAPSSIDGQQQQSKQRPDAFFLQKELVLEPIDSEVERFLNDGARRALEATVNEQRKIATNVDTTVHGSTHVSASISTSQELAKDFIDGAKSHKSILKSLQSAQKPNKFTGGFYIIKGRGATGVMAPVPLKGNDIATVDGESSTHSDDNDSNSTLDVSVSQFASIDNICTSSARKNSDDATSEASNASERTVAEPYLTSIPSDVIHASTKAKPIMLDDNGKTNDSTLASNADDSDMNSDGVSGVDVATTEIGDNKVSVDASDSAEAQTTAAKKQKDRMSAVGNHTNHTHANNSEASEGTFSQGSGAIHQFVTLHDDFDLLSDEALLSLSELRSKIDEVDRIRAKRDVVNTKKKRITRPQMNLIRPSAPLSKRNGNIRIGKGTRGAWEEPPAGRMHGVRVSDKMFLSTLSESAEGMQGVPLADTVTSGMPTSSPFGTSPSNRVGPSNFTGSRPNSRGAVDSKNANMKNAIHSIIRTNVTSGGAVEFGEVPSAAVRGLRSVASRNSARNTHISAHNHNGGLSPLDLALKEARAMGPSLVISPRTAFDDRSVSSTDSYRSYSSQYSSEAGISLNSPRTALRKSALSIAMAEADSVTKSVLSVSSKVSASVSSTLPPASMAASAKLDSNINCDCMGNDDAFTEAECSFEKQGEARCGRSTPIPIITPRSSAIEPIVREVRQQSGSAPAQISVEREKHLIRQSTEDDEEELKGIF